MDLGGLLRWLRVSVVPALKLLEELGAEKGLGLYQIIKDITPGDYSKTETSISQRNETITSGDYDLS